MARNTAMAAIGVGNLDDAKLYVETRLQNLKMTHDARNTRMDKMEKVANLNVWTSAKKRGEKRVASPRAYNEVEGHRTLLLTKPPVITVPAPDVTMAYEFQAQLIEKYLYGAWHEMRMLEVIHDADHLACALSEGCTRLVYDPELDGLGEFPLVVQRLDPRNVFYREDRKRTGRLVEVAHHFKLKRRLIEQQHGKLNHPDRPTDPKELQVWLEAKGEYTDYWLECIVDGSPERRERPMGLMRRIFERRRKPRPDEEKVQPKQRKMFNCIMVDGEFVKKPHFKLGYTSVPYFLWGGITTGWDGVNRHLSVLYGMSGGENIDTGNASGMLATENDLYTMSLEILRKIANNVWATNDKTLAQKGLKTTPDAINLVDQPRPFLHSLAPANAPPQLDAFMNRIGEQAERAGLPRALHGQYVGDVSGVYISLITNPVLMRIARMQMERQSRLEEMNELILSLTEEWAPDDGWPVYYKGPQDKKPQAVQLKPGGIQGYYRNRVKLSAMLPRDAPAEMLAMVRLVEAMMLSRYSAIERIQEIADYELQSPDDELIRIWRERAMADPVMQQLMSQLGLQKYAPQLAQMREAMMQQGQGQQGGPQTAGQGPMAGMPPQAVPPERVPTAVAQEGQQAAMEEYLRFVGQGGPVLTE